MNYFNVFSRRTFLDRSFKTGLGVALATGVIGPTLIRVPAIVKLGVVARSAVRARNSHCL
jgi:hypothetical protein